MKKIISLWPGIFVIAAALFLAVNFAQGKVIQQQLNNQKIIQLNDDNIIVRTMAPAGYETKEQFRTMRQRTFESHKRWQSYPEKEIYEPDKCDRGMRPRMYVQVHCPQI